MTTKELIEILQKADPTGNAHIRMEGGIPWFAQLKEGYWDGPYSYIDKDGNWVYTTKEDKVDLYLVDVYDFVVRQTENSKEIPIWDEVKSKFKFELGYSMEHQRIERESKILDEAKSAYDEWTEYLRERNTK
jgi:hypothetical protein